MELRKIHLNGHRGRRQAEVGLQMGSSKKAHVVVIADALCDQTKWPSHPTCDLTWNSKYLSVYTRKNKNIRVEG